MSTQLKFDGPRLDELLERVGRELGPDAIIVEANRTRRGGVGGFFAKEWFEVVVDASSATAVADAAAADTRTAAAGAAGQPVGMGHIEPDPLLALADQVDDVMVRTGASSTTFAGVLAEVGAKATTASQAPHRVAAPSVSSALLGPVPVPSATPAPHRDEIRPTRSSRLRDLPLGDMLAALDQVVGSALSPSSAHPIIAIVGDLSVARGVAATVAAQMGLGPADVLVATPDPREGVPTWLRIDTAEAAQARVARWRRGEHPVVLAVDLVPGREGHAWAAEILAALDADQIRLVARAWQVTEELAAKAAVLGGVDGLELVEVEAAAEPEVFLDLDLPVLGIDGRRATSELWAALLMERRADAPA